MTDNLTDAFITNSDCSVSVKISYAPQDPTQVVEASVRDTFASHEFAVENNEVIYLVTTDSQNRLTTEGDDARVLLLQTLADALEKKGGKHKPMDQSTEMAASKLFNLMAMA